VALNHIYNQKFRTHHGFLFLN